LSKLGGGAAARDGRSESIVDGKKSHSGLYGGGRRTVIQQTGGTNGELTNDGGPMCVSKYEFIVIWVGYPGYSKIHSYTFAGRLEICLQGEGGGSWSQILFTTFI